MHAPPNWQKSSFSGGGEGNACVEVATLGQMVCLRESDDPSFVINATRTGLAGLIRDLKKRSDEMTGG